MTLLFLSGVTIQIGAALLYKTAMWYLYLAELRRIPKSTKRVRVSSWLSLAYWLEFIFDGLTLAAFGAAT